ncbi:growth-regulated alpha protein-like [Anoplopoma fimbria]|uniref:growth-regulated alpha protein-like n=1 Tax=Anoplopoma fimbria TaxID=229290 RepID=UPI0023EE2845|nr:growth-regulated alpha protein-like [Anoplopoma fimbria]
MNTAIRCIIILACTIICTSASIINCRCARSNKAVKPSLIAEVMEYGPRPYCNKNEVIVRLKDKSSRCLDPNQDFTKAVLRAVQMLRRQLKMNTTSPKTTTSSATAPTSLQ